MAHIGMQAFYAHLRRPLEAPDERLQGLARLSKLTAAHIAAMTSAMAWDSWSAETAA